MAVELEPRPEDIGTRMSQWMRRPAGAGAAGLLAQAQERARDQVASRRAAARPGPVPRR